MDCAYSPVSPFEICHLPMVCYAMNCQFFAIFAADQRVKGIEPSSVAWKATALPLSYTRIEPVKLPCLHVLAKRFFHGIATCQPDPSLLALSYETNRSFSPARRGSVSSRRSYPRAI